MVVITCYIIITHRRALGGRQAGDAGRGFGQVRRPERRRAAAGGGGVRGGAQLERPDDREGGAARRGRHRDARRRLGPLGLRRSAGRRAGRRASARRARGLLRLAGAAGRPAVPADGADEELGQQAAFEGRLRARRCLGPAAGEQRGGRGWGGGDHAAPCAGHCLGDRRAEPLRPQARGADQHGRLLRRLCLRGSLQKAAGGRRLTRSATPRLALRTRFVYIYIYIHTHYCTHN